MRAGSLKHKIVIQTYSITQPLGTIGDATFEEMEISYGSTQNSLGEVVKGWVDFKTAYASISPISAKEFYNAGTKAEVTHKIEIRYISGVKPKMRIVYGDRIFGIESILNIAEANKILQLICTEVIDG